MKFDKTNMIHPFVFAIFPIIHLYSINFIEVNISEIIFPLLISILATGIFLILSKFILKDWIKAGFVVSLLLILTFSYGHLYDFLNDGVLPEIGRHSYLLPLFLGMFIVGTVLIIKTKINLKNFKTIINGVAITLIIITLPNFVYGGVSTVEINQDIQSQNYDIIYELKDASKLNSTKNPDVYYIVLDGYGGTDRMKQDLGFDNSEFHSELVKKGFFAPQSSMSNYPSTGWQMTSTFSMNYLDEKESEESDAEYQSSLSNILYKNEVMRNFHEKGYEIIEYQPNSNFESEYFFVDKLFCHENTSKISKFESTLLRTTILNYLNYLEIIEHKRQSILCGFSEISNLKNDQNLPMFVYMHLQIPHPPYVFDSNGGHVLGGKAQTEEKSFVNKDQFVETTQFANKKILETINKILESNKNSIIIIQSDHGYDFGIDYQNPSELHLKQRFSNLNAIYIENTDILYEGITPVNTFRIIFNEYFDASYDILEDKMYYHPYGVENRYKNVQFKDVTEILLN